MIIAHTWEKRGGAMSVDIGRDFTQILYGGGPYIFLPANSCSAVPERVHN